MKLKEVLDKTVEFFKSKKIETPRLDAEILLSKALNLKNRMDLYLKFDQPLSESEISLCREMVKRRSLGEPVAYITGNKDFYGLSFLVDSSVLIPRPETEMIVESAIDWIKSNKIESPKILDLGTGSGCILISILKNIPDAHGIAVEKSNKALDLARKNAETIGVSDRIEFINSDVVALNLTEQSFDLIVSNPPYISTDDTMVDKDVLKYEPHSALFAGNNGTADLQDWSLRSHKWLKQKSLMLFEIGFEQGPEILRHFENFKIFQDNKILKDLSGHDRVVLGEKNG